MVAENFEELKAEFEQGGCGSGGIEAEGDRDDGSFCDRHPSVFSIEVGFLRRFHGVISGCLWTPVISLKACMCWVCGIGDFCMRSGLFLGELDKMGESFGLDSWVYKRHRMEFSKLKLR